MDTCGRESELHDLYGHSHAMAPLKIIAPLLGKLVHQYACNLALWYAFDTFHKMHAVVYDFDYNYCIYMGDIQAHETS